MADRIPIGTVPGLTSQLDAVDILVATLGVPATVTRVLLRHTDYDDGGATDTSVVGSIRNATGGGGSGISFTIPDQTQSVVATGSLSVSASESIYLRVTTGSASMNLTGWIEVEGAAGVTTALTNLARVKEWLSETGSGIDAILTSIIAGTSQRMQGYMSRSIVQTAITAEKHDGKGRDTLTLLEFPVIVPPAVAVTENGDTVATTEYEVDEAAGQLIKVKDGVAGEWTPGRRNYSVDYTAGYATVPEDLAFYATLQAAYLYGKKGTKIEDRGTILDPGGSSSVLTGPWAPGVRECLDQYRDRRAA